MSTYLATSITLEHSFSDLTPTACASTFPSS
jgi:hypothetical protein